MDNEQREKLHQTAALQCLLCGEDKAARIAEKIPQIVETLRATLLQLDVCHRSANIDAFAPARRVAVSAMHLLEYIDGGRDSYP